MLTNTFFKTRTDGKELSNSSMVGRSSETEFTVSLWGFPSGLTQSYGQGIYTVNGSFYNNNDPGGIFRIFIFPGGGVKVQTGAGGLGGQLILGNADSPIQMNKWFHLMLVLKSNTLNIFVNEQDKTSLATVTGTISTMPSLKTGAVKNYMLGYYNSTVYSWQGSLAHVAQWDSDKSSDISTIYNNGQPGDLTSLSPKNWWKLTDGSLVDSGSEADNAVALSTLPTIVATNVNSNSNAATSSGMTEADLAEDNVSTVNGESDTLPGTALVQSNLTRKQPFSSYSIDYNGTDEKITLASSISTGNNYTVSFWLNPDNISSGNSYIFSDSTTSPYKGLALDQGSGTAGGFGNFYYYTGSVNVVNNTAINGNSWSHIVITFDVTGQEIKFYVNGVLDKTNTSVANIGTLINEFATRSAGNYFNGKLSNVSIFNQVLTENDVLNIYNNGVPQDLSNFRITPTNWYPMDQSYTYFNGSVLVARDVISGNDGTGANVIQENIVGNAPGSDANGTGSNLTIADLKGDMKSSINNSYSINMADYADGVTNPANSGRSTNVP